MINPSMVTAEVGRAVDGERIRTAQAARANRLGNDAGGDRSGRRSIVAGTADLLARAFAFRSRSRRRAATTGW